MYVYAGRKGLYVLKAILFHAIPQNINQVIFLSCEPFSNFCLIDRIYLWY